MSKVECLHHSVFTKYWRNSNSGFISYRHHTSDCIVVSKTSFTYSLMNKTDTRHTWRTPLLQWLSQVSVQRSWPNSPYDRSLLMTVNPKPEAAFSTFISGFSFIFTVLWYYSLRVWSGQLISYEVYGLVCGSMLHRNFNTDPKPVLTCQHRK